MNEAIRQILATYEIRSVGDSLRALREVMQEIALLGLWRSKFFEKAAFYGGPALRVLYGLDRFSEDLDFSLLEKRKNFDLANYSEALKRELASFGFAVEIEGRMKQAQTAVQSAFLKADTRAQMITVEFERGLIEKVPRNQALKIRLEVDIDPPPGFSTEVRYLLRPVPFAVKTFSLPDLFAGKMHAVLCREWKSRVKGRDWYDLVWFAAYHPELHIAHLEQRMRQTGHWEGPAPLTAGDLRGLLAKRIEKADIEQIRHEVEPFVKDAASLAIWSKEFFLDVASRIKIV
jgi:predicted nucleotidyltransferase component of viral defense system